MPKPLLIFDGDCGFCRRWIAYWQSLTGDRVDYAPYQEVGSRYPGIPTERFQSSVQLVEPDGRISGGADAVFRTLATRPKLRWLHWAYRKIPGVARLTEAAYRLVASNRIPFSRLTYWLYGERVEPARYGLVRWLYLKGLGATYLVAFLSFWAQAKGLVGPEGILPSGYGASSLDALCALGAASAVALMSVGSAGAGWLATAAASACWLAYWLVAGAGQDFLAFQWDALMLEMGFLSIFLTLGRGGPARPAVWLLRWLLFRVVFFSGYVKLASGDPAWRDLTALRYHFETQPLPTWLGWAFHQLPPPLLRASAAAMFALELAVPLLYFFPRRPRVFACFATVMFQILIDATGNYGFFGLQVATLSILLLDDQFVRDAAPRLANWLRPPAAPAAEGSALRRRLELAVLLPVVLLVVFTTVRPVLSVQRLAAPLNSIHSYGVFAVMTTTRNEIVFEGSRDGRTWTPYELNWKPGDPARRPSFVEPHMPRLDWQLWFAALGSPNQSLWVGNVAVRLLQNSSPVLGLFARNPFPEGPPKYVRASFFEYHFTSPAELRETGRWWRREPQGLYLEPISLRSL